MEFAFNKDDVRGLYDKINMVSREASANWVSYPHHDYSSYARNYQKENNERISKLSQIKSDFMYSGASSQMITVLENISKNVGDEMDYCDTRIHHTSVGKEYWTKGYEKALHIKSLLEELIALLKKIV